jgi:hypothetical protein
VSPGLVGIGAGEVMAGVPFESESAAIVPPTQVFSTSFQVPPTQEKSGRSLPMPMVSPLPSR